MKRFLGQMLLVLLGLVGLLGILILGKPNRLGFQFQHEVFAVRELGSSYPSREVHFKSRSEKTFLQDVQECIRAYEIQSLEDGQTATCVAYGSREAFEMQQADPHLQCEQARAIQDPYGSAAGARILPNLGEHCAAKHPDL